MAQLAGPVVAESHLAGMKEGMEDWVKDSGRLEGRKGAVGEIGAAEADGE